MPITTRDNAAWRAQLVGDGRERAAALTDLRAALLAALRHALSTRRLSDEAFFEDVVQDSLVRILDRIDQFQGRSRFLTWATAIAIRVALSELRRRRWSDVSLDQLVADGALDPSSAIGDRSTAEGPSQRQAILESMHALIRQQLTERQRVALLAELRGMPQDEIARHLGSNRNAIYKLTHDARKRLKRGLEAAGYAADEVIAAFDF